MAARKFSEERYERQLATNKAYYQRNRERIIARVSAQRATKRRKSGTVRFDPAVAEAARLDPVMSYDEIAEELGMSKARVGQLVEKALRKLRARFPQLKELLR